MNLDFILLIHASLAGLTFFKLLLENRKVNETLAWVLVIWLLPFFGILLYILLGFNFRKNKLIKQTFENIPIEENSQKLDLQKQHLQDLGKFDNNKLIYLGIMSSKSPIVNGNLVDVFYDGQHKFLKLIELLEGAKEYIHLEYFIWKNDTLGKKIQNILIKKAQEGVEVKIIYDALGSWHSMTKKSVKELKAAGIEVYSYLKPRFKFTITTVNNRNHRKIVIIDGCYAFMGGMNIGEEYITGGRRFKSWKDTHLLIQGPAINYIQSVFNHDWENTCAQHLDTKKYSFGKCKHFSEGVPIQIITSGPDDRWTSMEQIFFSMIGNADKSIFIETPYFIPSEGLIQALIVASLSGIEITIVVTGIPDKYLPFWTANTYFKDLLNAGITIYKYQKGFLHSKIIVIDEEVCSIGTANFDIRSLEINYEISALIYSREHSEAVINDIKNDIKHSKQLTKEDLSKTSLLINLRNSLARLFSPLL